MTADPIRAERDRMRAVTFAAALRRIADHIVDGTLPAPSTSTSLAWYPRGTEDEQREQAATIARTLGGEWRADSSPGSSYLRAVSSLTPGAEHDGALVVSVSVEHERPPVTAPGEAFAAELAAAVADEREARIAAVGGHAITPLTPEAFEAASGIPASSLLVVDEQGAPVPDAEGDTLPMYGRCGHPIVITAAGGWVHAKTGQGGHAAIPEDDPALLAEMRAAGDQ